MLPKLWTKHLGLDRYRSFARLDKPAPGGRVWFEGTDRMMREIEIVDIKRSNRLSMVVLSGAAEALQHIVGGTYLYGVQI